MFASRCFASIQALRKMSPPLPNTTMVDSASSTRRSVGERCMSMPVTITGAVSQAACAKRCFASARRACSRSTMRRRCAKVSIGRGT